MKQPFTLFLAVLVSWAYMSAVPHSLAQGPLIPIGAPAPTMKTLDQIESRTPITQASITIGPGSYYLTTNLTGVAGQNGIEIDKAHGITIDLNGFSLIGVPGSLHGITTTDSTRGITILNGTIRGWGGGGISLDQGSECDIRKVTVMENSGVGILAGDRSRVEGCIVTANGNGGVKTLADSTVENCTVTGNTSVPAIDVADGTTVRSCTVEGNGEEGIFAGSHCAILENHVRDNGGGGGIRAFGDANRIENNQASGNAVGLKADGIDNYVAGNIVKDNADNYDFAAGNKLNLLLCEIPESFDWPASVTLAGTLTGVNGADGITVTAGDVTIDLAGHTLRGVAGSGDGITSSGAIRNLRIHNGTVRDWDGGGVHVTSMRGCHLQNIDCLGNQFFGILTGSEAIIENCTAVFSQIVGIGADMDSLIRDCTSSDNQGAGIGVGDQSQVLNCTVYSNGFSGVDLGRDCIVLENTIYGQAAGAPGISTSEDGSRIEANRVTDNGIGLQVTGSNNVVSANRVKGNADNYDFAAGNKLNLLLCEIPESIDWPASVTLVGSLTGISGSNGVTINSSHVTLDLDGHVLKGVPGSYNGIELANVVAGAVRDVTIRNGTVEQFGERGILSDTAFGTYLINVSSVSNGAGFAMGVGVHVRGCTARGNVAVGIFATTRASIIGNVSFGNGGDGIEVQSGCLIRDNVAANNGGDGIEVRSGCNVIGNVATSNGESGIDASDFLSGSSLLIQNTATDNNQLGGFYANIEPCAGCTFGVNHAP